MGISASRRTRIRGFIQDYQKFILRATKPSAARPLLKHSDFAAVLAAESDENIAKLGELMLEIIVTADTGARDPSYEVGNKAADKLNFLIEDFHSALEAVGLDVSL
ncbi:hypothetical protein [Halalkalibacter oceani]|uniref:hypothetical protein n=1 Tax=Halalkalibacter oceani TaxID=1653776 RepID=UPI0033966B6F